MRRSAYALYAWLYLVTILYNGAALGYASDSPGGPLDIGPVEDTGDRQVDLLVDGMLSSTVWAVEAVSVPFHYVSIAVPWPATALALWAFALTPLWLVVWGVRTGRLELSGPGFN